VKDARYIEEDDKIRIILKNLDYSDNLTSFIRKNKLKLTHINTDEPTLGDVFIKLTQEKLREGEND
ncbi:MAG: hypothetical protein J7K26_02620, partial [Candidatus Aenigmarchaeota archaeon]|nr:hypothetical protein [Candidatus Aenigmarchaeota archaeon]